MKYRPDIDGLRAVAVLPVLLFHAGSPWVSGGYAGVDIFFVISGFLITSLILPDIAAGTFSLKQFYERRVRRIFPLLFFVISLALLTAFWLMVPGQLEEYAKSALAALFSVSNIFFWKQDSYFAESADLKPLLHTWSLGIEEQYYVIFPLLLLLIWRYRRSDHLLPIVAGVAAYSFFLANWGGVFDSDMRETVTAFPVTLTPEYGYYHLATRAWELLCGSLAAIILWQYPERVSAIRNPIAAAIAWLGLGGIIASYALLERTTPYPSFYTLPAVLGAVAIILFCRADSLLHRLLSLRPIVFTGLISYSLYLWHQPVFAFARIITPDLTQGDFYLLIMGIYALSILSWRWIETPFRDRQAMPTRRLYQIMGTWFAVLVITTGITAQQKGFLAYYPAFVKQFYISYEERGKYVEKGFYTVRNKDFPHNKNRNLLIIGDSQAQDFTNIMFESSLDKNWNISMIEVPARCQIYIGPEDPFSYIKNGDHKLCRKFKSKYQEKMISLIKKADRIVLAASWELWAAQRIDVTLSQIKNMSPRSEVFIIGQKLFGTITYKKYHESVSKDGVQKFIPISDKNLKINNLLKEKSKEHTFIDIYDIFCTRATACPLLTPEGHLISYDGGHLTQDGARFMGLHLNEINALQ